MASCANDVSVCMLVARNAKPWPISSQEASEQGLNNRKNGKTSIFKVVLVRVRLQGTLQVPGDPGDHDLFKL